MAFDPTPVTGDLKRYKSAGHPDNDVDTSGGDIDLGAPVAHASTFLPNMPIPELGGGDLSWYYKECLKNENGAADALPAPKFFIYNGLFKPLSSAVITFACEAGSTEEGDVLVTFKESVGSTWTQETVTLDGDNAVTTSAQIDVSSDIMVERVTAGGALTVAETDIYVAVDGVTLGLIPTGYSTAQSLHQLAIETVVDSTADTADRLTSPEIGVDIDAAFSEAYDVDTALEIPGGLDLEDGEFIGLWFEITMPEEMPDPVDKLQVILAVRTYI